MTLTLPRSRIVSAVSRKLDQTKATSSAPTSDYQSLDVTYASASGRWVYPKYSMIYDGVSLAGPTFGASTTTGLCDGYYLNAMTTSGVQEFPLFGHLWSGSYAGLRCVPLCGGLGDAGWDIGSRQSGEWVFLPDKPHLPIQVIFWNGLALLF